ncbi:hypothetical protein BCR42DRAFT_90698 [Absidia repens]|uniref:Uncharacterized protein n=1 Tax=Absidia repens TaxID=90262 RepID=A0A1X2IYQ1_9FUNG|nr:hypothetical protein BCR42DRAFT_90698 [Absidia repens]
MEVLPQVMSDSLLNMTLLLGIHQFIFFLFVSGYDFGYLLNILTFSFTTVHESVFFFFFLIYSGILPYVYDIKHLMKGYKGLKGGLEKIASALQFARIRSQRQAGSDILLTCSNFSKRDIFFFFLRMSIWIPV